MTKEQHASSGDDRRLTKINSWRTARRSRLTKFFADENFLLYSINASACAQRLHTDISNLHTLRTHTHCERKPSWLVLCFRPRGRWKGREESRVCERLLCLGRRAVLEQAVHDQHCFDFSTFFESLQEGHKYALGQSERSSLTSQLIFIRQMPFSTFCREKAYVRLCFRAKKTVTFYFQSQWNIVTVSKGKKAIQANDGQLEESAKPLLFWSRQWGDRSSSATDRSFDVGLGKPLEVGGLPFSQPISTRLFILASRPFPGDPVRHGARWGRVRGYNTVQTANRKLNFLVDSPWEEEPLPPHQPARRPCCHRSLSSSWYQTSR